MIHSTPNQDTCILIWCRMNHGISKRRRGVRGENQKLIDTYTCTYSSTRCTLPPPPQYVLSIFTKYILSVFTQYIHTVYSQYIHTVYSQYIHTVYSSIFRVYIFTVYSHSIFSVYLQYIHRIFNNFYIIKSVDCGTKKQLPTVRNKSVLIKYQ